MAESTEQKTLNVTRLFNALVLGLDDVLAEYDDQQAVYGLDAQPERTLQHRLAWIWRGAGYLVEREVRYPLPADAPAGKAEYCDFLVGTAPQDAYHAELKVLSQFKDGAPNRNYQRWLLQPVAGDVQKLAKAPIVSGKGVVLLLFGADEKTVRHDVQRWEMKLEGRELGVTAYHHAFRPIADRQGNGYMGIVLADLSR